MATLSGSAQRLAMSLTLAVLLGAAGQSVVHGAGAPCRVRNVTQDTFGRSLARMVERAVDGDRLQVRGTCVGAVIVTVDLVIVGQGGTPTISGRGRARVLRVRSDARVSLRRLVLQRGAAPRGGGILNEGVLTVRRSKVLRNRAGPENDCGLVLDPTCVRLGGPGGGVLNQGTLVMIETRIRENKAGYGGGILNRGTMVLRRSTISQNVASDWSDGGGGGIANEGSLRMAGSTISWNHAVGADGTAVGAGIYNHRGTLEISNSTISRNVSHDQNGGWGAAIANGFLDCESGGHVDLRASTVTRNVARDWYERHGSGLATGYGCGETSSFAVQASLIAGHGTEDCSGTFMSEGRNLIGVKDRGCQGFRPGVVRDRVGTIADPIDPGLGPLAYYGGSTRVHALLPGSPAIDHAGRRPCTTARDQRGIRRPQGKRCDIGAFERR